MNVPAHEAISSSDLRGPCASWLPSGAEIGFNWFGRHTDQGVYMKFTRGQESFGGNAVIYDYPDQQVTIITATNAGPAETGDGPVEGWSRKTHQALAAIFVTD